MSFSEDVRRELVARPPAKQCCGLAFLSGLIRHSGSLQVRGGGELAVVGPDANLGLARLELLRLPVLLMALLPAGAWSTISRAEGEPHRVYFDKTGYYVADFFLDYYNSHGGLDMFGYPRSNQFIEDGHVVQYFQRARMEWWPTNPSLYQVQLTLLADLYYGPGAAPIAASQNASSQASGEAW